MHHALHLRTTGARRLTGSAPLTIDTPNTSSSLTGILPTVDSDTPTNGRVCVRQLRDGAVLRITGPGVRCHLSYRRVGDLCRRNNVKKKNLNRR